MTTRKLSKPVTITIEGVELAWMACHFFNHPASSLHQDCFRSYPEAGAFMDRWGGDNPSEGQFFTLQRALRADGIDWQASPHGEKLLAVGDHTVKFKPDAIQVGCTRVPNETVLAIAARITGAKV